MILNKIEKTLMNNPLRTLMQRHLARQLLTMGGRMQGGRALEVGCGKGAGVEIILDIFGADQVHAFDLDPRQVAIAKRRLKSLGSSVKLWQGSVTEIPSDDSSYDAAFDFAIIHHVPNWRDAIEEVFRVLKPGARFYCEEVLKHFIHRPASIRFLDHPLEDRFDHQEFLDCLSSNGFRIIAEKSIGKDFGWNVSEKPG